MKAPGVGVAAVIVDGERVLLARRGRPPAAGTWSFPGGRLELGERLLDGLRREIREECGLEIEVRGLLDVVEIVIGEATELHHWVVLDYLALPTSGTPRAGDDALEVRWATLAEIERSVTTPRVAEIAARALAVVAEDVPPVRDP